MRTCDLCDLLYKLKSNTADSHDTFFFLVTSIHPRLLGFVLLTVLNLTGFRENLSVYLICISLRANDAEHLFACIYLPEEIPKWFHDGGKNVLSHFKGRFVCLFARLSGLLW